ncbi:MAG: tetratricopeptide repeat protein [Promethearchaeota archaeon]
MILDGLNRVEQLKNCGKYEEALHMVNELENRGEYTNEDLLSLLLVKSSILLEIRQLHDAYDLAKKVLDQSKEVKSYEKIFDALHIIAWVHRRLGKLEESIETIDKAEGIINSYFPEPNKKIKKKYAELFLLKGSISFARGNLNLIKEYLTQGLEIAKEVSDKKLTMQFTINFGIYYGIKGNLEHAINYNNQGLAIAQEINDIPNIVIALNNLGWIYREQGKLDDAYDRINQSYILCKEIKSPTIPVVLDSLFHLALDKENLELAQKYLNEMAELKDKEEYKIIEQNYLINKALLLKANPRTRNLYEAEKILRKAVEREIVLYEAHIDAILNLCDILIFDLRNSNDFQIIEEIQPLISRLINIAQQNNSYPLLVEIYLLQSRLALLTFDIKGARRLLSEAQNVSEKYGLNRLTIKISNEHDELLKQLDLWQDLKRNDSSLSERLQLTHIQEQLTRMIKKRTAELPKLVEEDPLLLLFIAEGGTPIFSHTFSKDWKFSNELLSGFLTAFDSISKEVFSEGLDRAKFGNHTILITTIEDLSICYLFKGQSYYAKQKIMNFIERIQNSSTLWQTLTKSICSNQILRLKDHPSLESLIEEIFPINTVN